MTKLDRLNCDDTRNRLYLAKIRNITWWILDSDRLQLLKRTLDTRRAKVVLAGQQPFSLSLRVSVLAYKTDLLADFS